MWRVSSRSGVATLRTAIHLLLAYLFTLRRGCCLMMGQTDGRTRGRFMDSCCVSSVNKVRVTNWLFGPTGVVKVQKFVGVTLVENGVESVLRLACVLVLCSRSLIENRSALQKVHKQSFAYYLCRSWIAWQKFPDRTDFILNVGLPPGLDSALFVLRTR